ncbi:hypothetical protein SLS62_008020 [Diatrype stigma]|uniref:Uncharacterized protein n=1 Tax=Diatrype stigma TaxID=117547 RepID=A0AAN9UMB1_9PEZI
MGSKRSPEDDGDNTTKRRREHAPYKPGKSVSNIDQAYGQRGAFGSLEDRSTVPAWDSDLDCEDDSDALAYLRSVRTQASSIPHVVVAQKAGPPPPPPRLFAGTTEQEDGDEDTVDRSIYENGVGDSRGYYYDGAYTALPENYDEDYYDEDYDEEYDGEGSDEEDSLESSGDRPHNSSSDEIRDAYYASLTRQYVSLRKIVRTDPPQSAINALPSSNPTQVGKLCASTFSRWSGLIKATDPLPAQVAAMHKDSVVHLIRILLDGKSFREGHELRERTSRWIWALLARLPDRGELDYQEIGWIRELGKKAVLFMLNLTERELLQKEYGVGSGGPNEENAEAGVAESVLEAPTLSTQDDDPNSSKAEAHNTEADGTTNARNNDPGKPDGTSVNAKTKPLGEEYCPDPSSQQAIVPSADTNADVEQSSVRPPSPPPRAEEELEQGTAEVSDVEMQLDTDMEDGEVSEEDPREELEADIESAKARLLAQLQGAEESSPEPALTREQEETARAQINLRATLNMILTVAGEFYGQRDLLEFRNPFSRLSED